MIEFDSITTRGGDSGQTSIADGSRRAKDDLLIEVLGEVDELHASLGMVKASLTDIREQDEIDWIEQSLLRLGGMLAIPPNHRSYGKRPRINHADIEKLENWQRDAMEKADMPASFITYGGSEAGARADMARAICRRVERRVVTLIRERVMQDLADAQRFLNRLSDYLFVQARCFEDRE